MSKLLHGGQLLTPYRYSDSDYADHWAFVEFNFVEQNGLMVSLVAWRDQECLWHRLAIGLGNDGTFESSSAIFDIPAGTQVAPGATYLPALLIPMGMANISFLSGARGQMSFLPAA